MDDPKLIRVKLVLKVFAVEAALTTRTKVSDSSKVRSRTLKMRDFGSLSVIFFMIFSIN